ncbi:hypothetical protein LX36DRAFT_754636, partial [Colletotrichum falcatum]
MCNYTQREFRCNHVRWIVSRWCPLYARTQRRCPPHVTHCEYRGNEVCGKLFLSLDRVFGPLSLSLSLHFPSSPHPITDTGQTGVPVSLLPPWMSAPPSLSTQAPKHLELGPTWVGGQQIWRPN